MGLRLLVVGVEILLGGMKSGSVDGRIGTDGLRAVVGR
jgi:hypothetical protein